MKLSQKQIKEIADNLDCGMICYVHKESKEIKTMIDFDEDFGDTDLWEEEFEAIEENIDQYLKIEKMTSNEMFEVMEAFIGEVDNKEIRQRLNYALKRDKPFRNFKYEIDFQEDIRQQWFEFKRNNYQNWVRSYISQYG